ncbi:MAG: transposase, partial [Candidatus Omnitrophica bacterium]|nr:transposase [Candidatus Omnitrophota bacterium]
MSNNLFCGCDVAVSTFTTWLLLDDGTEPVKSFTLDNNQVGAQTLVDKLLSLAKEHCVTHIFIGTEATSMSDWHLLEFLSQSSLAHQFNLKLYRFNPKWIKNFKKSLAPKGKTDPLDSFAIAERLRIGRLPREYTPDFQYQPLRRLTRFRYHLMQSMAREKNFFLSNLFLKASSYSEVKPFRSLFGAT